MAFAVHLRNNDAVSLEAMAALCALLGEDIGREVEPLLAHAPSALAEALAGGAAQFAWVSPTLLLMSSSLATVVPLLSSVRDGETTFHSVVFRQPLLDSNQRPWR